MMNVCTVTFKYKYFSASEYKLMEIVARDKAKDKKK